MHGDKYMPVVLFQLGALMGGNGILQNQCMQTEFVPQPADRLAVWRSQFNPDKAVGLADMLADVVKRNALERRVVKKLAVDDGTRLR